MLSVTVETQKKKRVKRERDPNIDHSMARKMCRNIIRAVYGGKTEHVENICEICEAGVLEEFIDRTYDPEHGTVFNHDVHWVLTNGADYTKKYKMRLLKRGRLDLLLKIFIQELSDKRGWAICLNRENTLNKGYWYIHPNSPENIE